MKLLYRALATAALVLACSIEARAACDDFAVMSHNDVSTCQPGKMIWKQVLGNNNGEDEQEWRRFGSNSPPIAKLHDPFDASYFKKEWVKEGDTWVEKYFAVIQAWPSTSDAGQHRICYGKKDGLPVEHTCIQIIIAAEAYKAPVKVWIKPKDPAALVGPTDPRWQKLKGKSGAECDKDECRAHVTGIEVRRNRDVATIGAALGVQASGPGLKPDAIGNTEISFHDPRANKDFVVESEKRLAEFLRTQIDCTRGAATLRVNDVGDIASVDGAVNVGSPYPVDLQSPRTFPLCAPPLTPDPPELDPLDEDYPSNTVSGSNIHGHRCGDKPANGEVCVSGWRVANFCAEPKDHIWAEAKNGKFAPRCRRSHECEHGAVFGSFGQESVFKYCKAARKVISNSFVPEPSVVAEVRAAIDKHGNPSNRDYTGNTDAKVRAEKVLKGIMGEAGGYNSAGCREVARHYGATAKWKPWCDEIERRENWSGGTVQVKPVEFPDDNGIVYATVHDLEVKEGDYADIRITLKHPAPEAISFYADILSPDRTATFGRRKASGVEDCAPNVDFCFTTRTNNLGTVEKGDTEGVIRLVFVAADSHDDDGEYFIQPIVSGRVKTTFLKRFAKVTIRNSGALPRDHLAHFGHGVAGAISDAVAARADRPAPGVTGAFGRTPGPGESLHAVDTLMGSRISASDGRVSMWGRIGRSSFNAGPLSGETTYAITGTDVRAEHWVLGLAVTHAQGDATREGVVAESSLTAAAPYLTLTHGPASAWATFGYGFGDVTLLGEDADTSWSFAAAGAEHDLLQGETFRASLVSDVFWQVLSSDDAGEYRAATAETMRARGGVSLGLTAGPVELGSDIRARHEDGDIEGATMLDLGIRADWSHGPLRVAAEGSRTWGSGADRGGHSLAMEYDTAFGRPYVALNADSAETYGWRWTGTAARLDVEAVPADHAVRSRYQVRF